ncbi:30S ribosomal protein S13 [Candidatus Pacearchaeota archaeon]|nr:30S ribosomal protein S13 [Candidatus Pacearchaeota archaeon]|tara:strand:- start:2900 stop:3439 length:540 start_codon:yes stop_codon:yes gene_type:complete
MAKTQKVKDNMGKPGDEGSEEKKPFKKEEKMENLIRIMSTDIPSSKNVWVGLSKIKGVSFAMSNAICSKLKLDKKRKIESLSKEEIDMISEFIRDPQLPNFMKNRRFDFESGETKHLSVTDLDLTKEFDIKRLKKIRSYKGIRHSRGLPVRGQRTKSNFRKGGRNRVVGVKTKKGKVGK